jgi:hypothetical protein
VKTGAIAGNSAIAAPNDSANKGTTVNKVNINAIAVAVGLAFSAGAMAQTMSKDQYKSGKDGIVAEYKSAKAACGFLAGNAKDICMAGASGKEIVAQAELEAKYKPSESTSYNVRVARADADYLVAMERCDDKGGNVKDVCVKQAKAVAVAAKADAKAQKKTADAHETANEESAKAQSAADEKTFKAHDQANEKSAEARKDAASDKRAAEYAVAKQKCDAFASGAKSDCMNEAKALFGKS